MSSIDERIARLREEMLPLQKLYGLESRTIEERYRAIRAREELKKNRPKPRFRLPKL